MFKTARMRKIKIITLNKYSSSTVNALHEAGIVQISDISDRIQQDPELAELLTPSKSTSSTGKLSSLLMKTSGLSDLLGASLSEDLTIKDKIKSFIKPDIPIIKEVEDLSTEDLIKKAEETLSQVEAHTQVIEGKLSVLDTETSELQSNKSLANKLKNFDMDLALLKDSKYTSTTVGRISAESTSEIKNDLSNLTDELILYTVADDIKEYKIIVVVTLNEFKDVVYTTLRKFDFEKIEIGDIEGTPNDITSHADSRLKTIESERSSIKADLKAVAEEWDDEILSLKEQLENDKEKNEVFSAFARTEDTFMLEAWVPESEVENAKNVVDSNSEGHCTFEIEDAKHDDEDVPILQRNNVYAKPYEFLVGMYSPLKYNEVDPTLFVAITFPFFFGFCLTDAVYGLFVAMIGAILIRGIGKINETMKSFGFILVGCGTWSIILGLITNGFLGDLPERILSFRLPTIIPAVESFVHPDTILLVAITVGIIYTNIGFLLGAKNNLKYGNVKEALGSQIIWFIFEAGIILLVSCFIIPSLGLIGLILGAVLILISLGFLVYGNGFYGLMDVFGYMGDVLSYARLLALCLATGGIAMTVNILTVMVYGMVPYVGILFAIFVFIFGHIANFLFQVLGAFINALRLNYVEFFSQFFMGGKNKFDAFKANRRFTKIKN